MKYNWRRHIIKLKHYKQHTYESCGPACLRMILERFDYDISEKKLRKLSNCSKDGTDEDELKQAAEKLGFKATIHYNMLFSKLIKKLEKNVPLLVTFRDHWQVVVGYDPKYILIVDPDVDKQVLRMRIDKFKHLWEFNNLAMEFKPREN